MSTRLWPLVAVLAVGVLCMDLAVAQGGGAPAGPGAAGPGRGAGPGGPGGPGRGGPGGRGGPPLTMSTDAFPDGGIVPVKYAGRGGNVQPGFTFTNPPAGTVSYAIIFHDIDVAIAGRGGAPTQDVLHWIVWNIPVAAGGIPEGSLPAGAVQGANITGQPAYFGPGAPATPRYHHYVFELYALNANVDLPPTAGRPELLAAMEGKIVGKAAYVGRFRTETQQ